MILAVAVAVVVWVAVAAVVLGLCMAAKCGDESLDS